MAALTIYVSPRTEIYRDVEDFLRDEHAKARGGDVLPLSTFLEAALEIVMRRGDRRQAAFARARAIHHERWSRKPHTRTPKGRR